MLKYDYHCHSTISDGTLTPSQLVLQAHHQKVKSLAITDHDDIGSWQEAKKTSENVGIYLISGVEISTTWHKKTIHILGYGFDPENQQFINNLADIRQLRNQRAIIIDQILREKGIVNAIQGAQKIAQRHEPLSRTHFARFLIMNGYCKNFAEAMNKFLADSILSEKVNKWVSINTAIDWINNAGGVAFLAHPLRYRFPPEFELIDLIKDFIKAGGDGIEVVYAKNSSRQIEYIADIARRYNLSASGGSDFHTDDNTMNGIEIGDIAPIPKNLRSLSQILEKTIN